MGISVVQVALVLAGVLLLFVLARYLRLAIHLLILLGKVAVPALGVFAVVYAVGIWRPDLSPLFWLISKIWGVFR
jgi:hypothetical protein